MQRIRILLAEMPRMLGDIVENVLTEQPDMEVVGTLQGLGDVVRAATESDADVVIVGLEEGELPGVGEELVMSHPQAKVLALAADGRRAFLYELRPYTSPLGEVSPQGLVVAIRAAMASSLHA